MVFHAGIVAASWIYGTPTNTLHSSGQAWAEAALIAGMVMVGFVLPSNMKMPEPPR